MPSHASPDPAELLAWYDRHHRHLPWRVPPGAARPDPYGVWLSEIMLQQTTVATVKSYFEAFLARWPGVEALAAAPLDDVLGAWAGLGYYSRARNLHACARVVADELGGVFPDTEEGLLALPGIGSYTAAAIAAIAFDRPATVVDGNVERVIARLFAIDTPLPAAKYEIRARAGELTPARRPGDYAQAVMDLGATLCSPRRPACGLCPWAEACAANGRGIAETLPVKPPKAERPTRKGVAFLALAPDGAVFVRWRPPKGLLGGMLEVPSTPWQVRAARGKALAHAPFEASWRVRTGLVRHTFTHFHLELTVMEARVRRAEARGAEGFFLAPADWPGAALPTVMRKVLAFAGDQG